MWLRVGSPLIATVRQKNRISRRFELTEQTREAGWVVGITDRSGLEKNCQSIRRFSYSMRLAISEWDSTDVGGNAMLKAALIAAFIAVTALSPASAGSQGPVQ